MPLCLFLPLLPYANQTELDQHNSDMAAVEQERRRLQASLALQSQRVAEESLEKQQLTTQLELQHMELLTLKSELSFTEYSTQERSIIYSINKIMVMKTNFMFLTIIMMNG